MTDLYLNDQIAIKTHHRIFGIDEAGRGCLAGPVVIAGVELDYQQCIAGLNDSKQLSRTKREKLYDEVISSAMAYAIVEVDRDYIDRYNILQATLHGMALVMNQLDADAVYLIDGNKIPQDIKRTAIPVIKGDGTHACIAAASILAKVHRDSIMDMMHIQYPEYGFDRHAGYGTSIHLRALALHGPSPIHRLTYAPVAKCLNKPYALDM